MSKKVSLLRSACALFVLSLLAPAQTAPATLNARALGTLEGTLNFCTKVNPESADKYKELDKQITKGQSDEAVAKMRDSQEYKDSLDQISKQLGALPAKEAVATCKAQKK